MNKCGDCKACCEVLAVKGLKDGLIKCQHQTSKGCSIYKDRPKGCRHFKCAWLLSSWDKKYRPDKSGIMFATFPDKVKAFRIREKVDMKLFELASDISQNIEGYDARTIRVCNESC